MKRRIVETENGKYIIQKRKIIKFFRWCTYGYWTMVPFEADCRNFNFEYFNTIEDAIIKIKENKRKNNKSNIMGYIK